MAVEELDYMNLESMRLDALREIANIGAGNSATALSQLIRNEIDITVPKVNVVPVSKVGEALAEHGDVVTISFKVYGGAPGTMMLVFPRNGAFVIADLVQNKTLGSTVEITGMAESAVREVGNIVTGSYLNALAGFTQMAMVPSIPYMIKGNIEEVLETIILQFQIEASHAFILETEFFTLGKLSLKGHFLYIPKPGALTKIFESLCI